MAERRPDRRKHDRPERRRKRTGERRSARCLTALALVAVLVSAVPPVAAHGSTTDGSTPEVEAARDRLAEEFAAVLSLREASDSMCLSVMLDGEPIVESRSGVALTPASLMKVATAAASLEIMRPDDVFTTEVFARADDWESVADGVLRGDLYLVGQGDPVLSTPRYVGRYPVTVAHTDVTRLADAVFATLSARGVTRIEGRLVGDESWFPHKERDYSGERASGGADPVWKRSFVTSNSAGPLSGLLLNSGYTSYSGTVSGEGLRRNVRAADPAQHAASVFDDLLEARGMVITQRPAAGVAPGPGLRTVLGAVESPPLSEILARMLSRSDNTIAEMLLKEIGRRTAGSDRASAAASLHTFLRDTLGPSADGLVIADGSGLSYSNRLTCAAVAKLLVEAGPGSPLVEGLSEAGETGTLRTCAPAPRPGGDGRLLTVRAKTGTLNHVSALAGTTVAANGETLTFAMIVNKPQVILFGRCNRLYRTILNAAANYDYGPAPSSVAVHAGDRAALSALFDSTGGDGWFNSSRWKTDAPLGQWHGVATDPTGRVTSIDLGGPLGNGLTGSLPEEIGRLTELRRLDLSGNSLRGRLPDRISDLAKLTDLRLSGTGLCVPRSLRSLGSLDEALRDAGVGTCSSFVDTPGSAHSVALDALAERGVLDGTGCAVYRICPGRAIERWAMAVWLVRAIDGADPPAVDGSTFDDVDEDVWWMPYVERLADLRITAGCSTRPLRFCPEAPVTRAQMASFLVRAFDLDPAPSAGFEDTPGDAHEAAIDTLAAAGVTVGCHTDPLRYCPSRPVTRAQMATFLARALGLA